ncbi:RNA (Cytosine-C(5)-)-methyltransferase [Acidilobus saccharovorans 345-15]|uniref:tRNA (cytosine(72)-C(5))-methyltransferase n=1 Tax=Acidilobus saccharovorans (strain DSM 16705 / JCM 18335 / VKM B-2471 / 345-15) TaxID=666510 RepID=D9Q289_ACIS3|nr:RsmB/NOP family class I SAM-dependent RNA methyltransferase [Acidilobus saccharovorans]ADL19427.1 RNA (Cytosine-C(5)-)-methyltransferase [Acidilobus saccharovorans 345-15]
MSIESLIYDQGLLESLGAISRRGVRSLLESLLRPPRRFYLRVNTLKADTTTMLDLLSASGTRFYVDEQLPYAIWIDVKGPFKVDLHDKVVVADKKSAESVYVGSDLYGPGVLRAERVKAGDEVTIVTVDGRPVAEGVAIMDGKEMAEHKKGVAVKVTKSVYATPKVRELPGFNEGLIYSQSLPSMWAVAIASPSPGETIIDFNAAPGGKTSLAAQLAGRKSRIIAIDRASKAEKLRDNLIRLGADWVNVVGGDSRRASSLLNIEGKADLVLIDPPCTNLGVIPKLYDTKRLADAVVLSRYQRQFISEAWKALKPGGRLVYSTCTLTDVENEANVLFAMELGFEVTKPYPMPREASYNGLGLRFSPEDGHPGFFISLMVKPYA